jgi:DNA-binding transcriptional LysR family regulator
MRRRSRDLASLATLANLHTTLLTMDNRAFMAKAISTYLEEHEVEFRRYVELNSVHEAIPQVEANFGVSIVPRPSLREDHKVKQLELPRQRNGMPLRRQLAVIYPPESPKASSYPSVY